MNCTEVVAYTQDGAIYHPGCFEGDTDSDDVGAVFAGDEWEYAPTCDSCGEVIEELEPYEEDDEEEDEED